MHLNGGGGWNLAPSKLQLHLSFDLARPFPEIDPTDMPSCVYKMTITRLFTVALF